MNCLILTRIRKVRSSHDKKDRKEIVMLMDKEEFDEFCETWKEVHDNE